MGFEVAITIKKTCTLFEATWLMKRTGYLNAIHLLK